MQLIYSYIWILWDLLAVGILARHVYICANRGFVSTIIRLLIYIVAVAVAHILYIRFGDFLYDYVVRDVVQHSLTRSFNEMLNSTGSSNDIVYAMPAFLRMLLGFKRAEVSEIPVAEASEMAAQVIDVALKGPVTSLLYGMGFMLLFVLSAYVVRYIARFFTRINRVPVLGVLNMTAGGIAGVAEGLIILAVSGFALQMLIDASDGVWWWLNYDVIQSTYIWKMFV